MPVGMLSQSWTDPLVLGHPIRGTHNKITASDEQECLLLEGERVSDVANNTEITVVGDAL